MSPVAVTLPVALLEITVPEPAIPAKPPTFERPETVADDWLLAIVMALPPNPINVPT